MGILLASIYEWGEMMALVLKKREPRTCPCRQHLGWTRYLPGLAGDQVLRGEGRQLQPSQDMAPGFFLRRGTTGHSNSRRLL
jgi:hypothetical protein